MTRPASLAAALLLLSAAIAAASDLPLKVNFQGKLLDPVTNVPKNGTFSMTFRVYAAPSGGAALYTETQGAVPVSNGVFSVQIGSSAALSPDLFAGASAYLSLQVSPDAEMTPRQQLVMSPYAMTAAQLVGDAAVRVRAGGTAYSTFTSAGNLTLPAGVTATTGTFSGTGGSVYSVTASSGILSQAGTVRVLGAGGVRAEHEVRGGSVTAASWFQAGTPAATPAVSPAGSLRAYYDSTLDGWLISVNGRAYSTLGRVTTTLWNSDATAGVANQGLNLPNALTELDSGVGGTRMLIDCDDLPAQLALRYNLRTLQTNSLTITISVRDVSDTNNVLATVSQPVNAIQNWTGQGSYADKPGWCSGTKTVAVYTSGGDGTRDYIFKHVVLLGKP